MRGVTYEDMRPGSYEREAAARGHGHQPPRGLALLPHLPALLRPDLHRGRGQGARPAVRQGLQRLDGRGVVRPEAERPPIPLTLVPLWDAELAAAEVRRNADRGVRAVCFSEIPPFLGLPSVHDPDHYWDPFFRACDETGTVINMHIGSSSKMPSTSADAPPAVGSTLTHSNATYSMVDFMFSGVLVRFPELKLAYAEGQIGWIPYILERADKVWEENRGWGGVADIVPEPPSTYFHRPDLRLLLRRRLRTAERRVDRRRQHHLRVRLPPLRLHLAQHPPDRREADEGPHRRADLQDRPGQRHQALRPRLQVIRTGRAPGPPGLAPDAPWTCATPTPSRRSGASCAAGWPTTLPGLPTKPSPDRLAGPPRLRHPLAAPAVRRRLRRGRLAGRGRRPRLLPGGGAHLQRGARTGPRPLRRGQLRRPPPRRARPSSPRARPSSVSATCPRSCRGTRSGARASPSPTPAATWPPCAPGPCGTVTTTSSPGRRSGPPTPRWPTTASCWCAPAPRTAATAASRG